MNLKLEVKKLNNEDVIATSTKKHYAFQNVNGKNYGYLFEMTLLSESDSIWAMQDKDDAKQVAKDFLDEMSGVVGPTYVDVINVYVFDEATGTYSKCTEHAHHYVEEN